MDEMETLLRQAQNEIISMRRRIELLQARCDTIDLVARLVGGVPRTGEGEDIAWKIDVFLHNRAHDAGVETLEEIKKPSEHRVGPSHGGEV